jgi:alkanesulfonate monooxygenase SsuD/methylene tetrahydromethanopterin reductase-like flavin-dependent oxidoreductase (luciferase family)
MRVGIGLPSTIAGASRDLILQWAQKADDGPFSTVGVFDRLAYDSYDPLVSLAACAAVTHRIQLATTILAGPLYNTTLLAKAAASLDVLSGGRLVLGVAVGARDSDYKAAGIEPRGRGKRLSEQLLALRAIWEEHEIGPRPRQAGGPKLLVGGASDAVLARMARYAHGYIHGGGPPRAFARAADRARAAWTDAGRPDHLHLWGMAYYALGDAAVELGRNYLLEYYSFTGPFADRIAAGLLTTPAMIRECVEGYEAAGCEELILFPTVGSMDQISRLAEAVHSAEAARSAGGEPPRAATGPALRDEEHG